MNRREHFNSLALVVMAILVALPTVVAAQVTPVYKSSNLVMGYVRPGQQANVAGYSRCFTSIGNYLSIRSDNSANIHPVFEVTVTNSNVVINNNAYADGIGAYVCHNDALNREEITAGTVADGTSIGLGLSCVTTIANFSKVRQDGGTVPGSVSCTYDPATGLVKASAAQAGIIGECNYVCAKPSQTKTTQTKSVRYQQVFSGQENIGASLNCAKGTNYFFSICSNAIANSASYDRVTGLANKGSADGCSQRSHSYFCAATPKTQCGDGLDNDSDGVIDAQDPGCWSNPSNPASYDANRVDEAAATTQCQDGIDNDNDGAIDRADQSCSGPLDNDETNPKSQCQDGIDNDGDGAADMADFSCSGKQDNDEANPKSSCQDGIDNDQDGSIDTKDPGCSNNQDNDEGDEPSLVEVGVECVFDNQDGSFTAYFGYENRTNRDLEVISNLNTGTINEFAPGSPNRGQTTTFKVGRQQGVVSVVFNGQPLTWRVRAASGRLSSASASSSSSPCKRVTASADCINGSASGLVATFGYTNPNPFDVIIPVGALNNFSPVPADRSQPTRLKSGRNSASFSTTFNQTLTWNLDGVPATVSKATPICVGGCIDQPVGAIKNELNQAALDLAELTKRAAKILAQRARKVESQGKLSRGSASRIGLDAKRAAKKADELARRAQSLTLGFPEVIKSCPFSAPFCQTVDRGGDIEKLRGLFVEQVDQVRRIMARSSFNKTGKTSRQDPLVAEAQRVKTAGNAQLDQFPRVETKCD